MLGSAGPRCEADDTVVVYSYSTRVPIVRIMILRGPALIPVFTVMMSPLPKYYHEALQESELKVVNVVDATEVEIKDNEPVTFDVTVDIEPEFKLSSRVAKR